MGGLRGIPLLHRAVLTGTRHVFSSAKRTFGTRFQGAFPTGGFRAMVLGVIFHCVVDGRRVRPSWFCPRRCRVISILTGSCRARFRAFRTSSCHGPAGQGHAAKAGAWCSCRHPGGGIGGAFGRAAITRDAASRVGSCPGPLSVCGAELPAGSIDRTPGSGGTGSGYHRGVSPRGLRRPARRVPDSHGGPPGVSGVGDRRGARMRFPRSTGHDRPHHRARSCRRPGRLLRRRRVGGVRPRAAGRGACHHPRGRV